MMPIPRLIDSFVGYGEVLQKHTDRVVKNGCSAYVFFREEEVLFWDGFVHEKMPCGVSSSDSMVCVCSYGGGTGDRLDRGRCP
jgi:hypothetical protein